MARTKQTARGQGKSARPKLATMKDREGFKNSGSKKGITLKERQNVIMFKCQECQENYNAKGSNPVMPILMDCGHDICKDCAKKGLCDNGILCCPSTNCKKKHERFPLDSLPFVWSLIKSNQNNETCGMDHPSVNKRITVYLRDPTGNIYPRIYQLNVLPTVTVKELKQFYCNKVGRPQESLRFVYGSKHLFDGLSSKTIRYHGIKDQSEVNVLTEITVD